MRWPSKTVDVKISFPQYNCQPGREEFDKFERNLLAHGGTSDNEGWSLADSLMRTDDGAVDAMGNPMPGVGALSLLQVAKNNKWVKISRTRPSATQR